MTIREKVARYCLISNILQGITLVLVIGFVITLVVWTFLLTGLIGESAGLMENVNPDDVTAGWQVLFGAAGSFLGLFAQIMLVCMIIFMVGPIIAQIVALVYGIRTYKMRDLAEFKSRAKNDSIIKLVMNAVMVVVLCFIFLPSSENAKAFVGQLDDYAKVLIFALPSMVCVVVSIRMLRTVNDLEELPKQYGQQYIEYDENNAPYFGQ